MEQENITERLIDYIDGKLSAEERAEIREWLENDPNLLAEYEQLRMLLRHMNQPLPEVPSGKMTQRFESWLESNETKPKTRILSSTYLYRIAASLVILILAGGAWFMVKSSLDSS